MLLTFFVFVDIFSYSLILPHSRVQDKKISIQNDSLENYNAKNIPKLSDIKSPRIDDEAASVEKIAVKDDKACTTLPDKIWIFLFLAYIILLIFNLSYNFNQAMKIQWLWELILTFSAVIVWYKFDSCRNNLWYPVFVIKYGIVIYVAYLYLLNKKTD